MFDFCLCEYSDCLQSMVCNRFLYKNSSNPVYIKFKNICSKEDNWQWFYGDRSKMIQVELIKDKEEGCE